MSEKTLYQQLAEAVGQPESQLVADIFESIADEKEAKVIVAAAPPATIEELAEKTGIAASEVEQMIDPLFKKGLIYKSKKPDAIRYYRVRRMGQFHDATAVMDDPPQKMLDLWKEYMTTEWIELRTKQEAEHGLHSRVVPVNVAIDPETKIMPFDDVKKLIEGASSMAVTRCSCRVIDGACGKEVWNCMQFGKAAEYGIERGTGRRITQQEAIDMLKAAAEEGLVHVSSNNRSVGNVICNCCADCCMNWPTDKNGKKKPFIYPSRFKAEVDADLCTSCETCVDRCAFDAITMDGEGDTAVIDPELCLGCGVCVVTCPVEAMSLKEVRPEDFVPAS
jgi:ferredoxin/predicted transcriptional regulator